MKKQLLTAALVGLSAVTFAQVPTGLTKSDAEIRFLTRTVSNSSTSNLRAGGGTSTQALGDTIFHETFGNGLNGDGSNGAWTNTGSPAAAVWEYRGPSTSPTNDTGSIGAFGGLAPITSTTAANGFMIFDSDYLDNGGDDNNIGGGPAPTPHTGELNSPIIDLTGYNQVRFSVEMRYRRFVADLYVLFSTDGGTTWGDTIQLFGEDVNTPSNMTNVAEETYTAYVDASFANTANGRIKFWFDGVDNHGNINGSGYYYAMIDDVMIQEAPENDLIIVSNQTEKNNFDDSVRLYYSNIPVYQALYDTLQPGALVASMGTQNQTNTVVTTTVTEPGGSSTVSSASATMTQGDTSYFFSSTPYVMDEGTGTYTFDIAAASDHTDDFPVDNSSSWSVEVTDNVYARDYDLPNKSSNGWQGFSYEIFVRYDINVTDTVTSFMAQWGDNSREGATVSLNLYADADLNTPIVSNQFISLSNSTNIDQWATYTVPETELTPGIYWLSYEIISVGDTVWVANNNDIISEPVSVIVDLENDGTVDFFTDLIPFLRMSLKGQPCANLNASVTNLSCFQDNSGEIAAQVSGGTGTFSYAWSNGGSTATISGLSAGTYTVTATNGSDCTVEGIYSVSEPTELTVSMAVDNPSFGTATANPAGGTNPYTYAWSSGGTGNQETVDAGGSVTVTVTDANGCTATATGDLTPVSTNDLQLASSLNLFPNPTSGRINISFENIEGVYTVSVVSTIGQVVENRTVTASSNHVETFNMDGLNNGIYFVTVKSESGSEATYRVVVK